MTRSRPTLLLLLLLGMFFLQGNSCNKGAGGAVGPTPTISVNSISPDLDDLLVLPTRGFVVRVTFEAGTGTINPASFRLRAFPWNGTGTVELTSMFQVDETGALGIVEPAVGLSFGTYTMVAEISDLGGILGGARFDFAVRGFPNGTPPIGTGQKIWFDFEVDRDDSGSPDFPEDLESFGLASPAAPVIAAAVEAQVIDLVLTRIEQIYYDEDPNGLGDDPVDVAFSTSDPGGSDVTRICVGGVAPSTPLLIGSIYVDLDNASREGVWCDSIPATGIFPRGIHAWQGNSDYQSSFSATMPSLGGTPLGEHALDAVVLDPGFDPGSASAEELARWNDAQTAIANFSHVLAGVTAHETGHALGLVAPGTPGIGMFGGLSGNEFSHNVEPDGSVPPENYLMKPGPNSNFSSVGGLPGFPVPFLRPFDHAYLRDRVVRDEDVAELLFPPTITGVSQTLFTEDGFVTIMGGNFAEPPAATLLGAGGQYPLFFMQFISENEIRGLVNHALIVPGSYFLIVENPDGQTALLLDLIEVQ